MKEIVKNKKAFHDYEIIEKFEAGIVLKGSEVKSIRLAKANLKDSFIRIVKGEMWLFGSHISYLNTVNSHYKPDEKAPRKLLMHRKQIDKLFGQVSQNGFTMVALSLYLNSKNMIKCKIALAKGKNLHDKRQTLKKRDADREARSAMKNY